MYICIYKHIHIRICVWCMHDAWMDGWMDGWMDSCMHACMPACAYTGFMWFYVFAIHPCVYRNQDTYYIWCICMSPVFTGWIEESPGKTSRTMKFQLPRNNPQGVHPHPSKPHKNSPGNPHWSKCNCGSRACLVNLSSERPDEQRTIRNTFNFNSEGELKGGFQSAFPRVKLDWILLFYSWMRSIFGFVIFSLPMQHMQLLLPFNMNLSTTSMFGYVCISTMDSFWSSLPSYPSYSPAPFPWNTAGLPKEWDHGHPNCPP